MGNGNRCAEWAALRLSSLSLSCLALSKWSGSTLLAVNWLKALLVDGLFVDCDLVFCERCVENDCRHIGTK